MIRVDMIDEQKAKLWVELNNNLIKIRQTLAGVQRITNMTDTEKLKRIYDLIFEHHWFKDKNGNDSLFAFIKVWDLQEFSELMDCDAEHYVNMALCGNYVVIEDFNLLWDEIADSYAENVFTKEEE